MEFATNPLPEAQAAVREARVLVRLVRQLLNDAERDLDSLERKCRALLNDERRWISCRVDELRLGDHIEWTEFHEGPLVVDHLGRAGDRIELGCDRWTADVLLPPYERVSVHPDRPPVNDPPAANERPS